MSIHSDYLHTCIKPDGLALTIKKCCERLKPYRKEFDGIAFRGMSGCLVAPAVAINLKKKLAMVRKGKSHSHKTVEGDDTIRRYVIIDDFISSGNTVGQISQKMRKFAPKAILVGCCLYQRKIHDPADEQDQILDLKRHSSSTEVVFAC